MKSRKSAGKRPEELFRKLLGKKSLLSCRRILAKRELCANCLGRQFAQLSTGMTNAERGNIIMEMLGAKHRGNSESCSICGGFFMGIGKWVDEAEEKLKPYEFRTFAVGTKPGSRITKNEEEFWEEFGIERCEPFRSESNREFGKALWKRIKKEVDESNPDVLVILDLGRGCIELDIRSVYIRGGYKKLIRGIPQTKWDMYPETVEDIIAKPFMEKLGGRSHSLHCAGREDIDARCLDWRPFVLEIEQPKKRAVNLKAMASAINKTDKVEVQGLRLSCRDDVVAVKSMMPDKEYRMLVEFEEEPSEEKLGLLRGLTGQIEQQTPSRVLHRRADLLRRKKVKSIIWHKIRSAQEQGAGAISKPLALANRNTRVRQQEEGATEGMTALKDTSHSPRGVSESLISKQFHLIPRIHQVNKASPLIRARRKEEGAIYEIQIRGSAGLYAKEFVTGDSGRTRPSVAETLGTAAKVLELDVIKIYANDKALK